MRFRWLVWGTLYGLAIALAGLGLRLLGLTYPLEVIYGELTHFLGTPEIFNFVHGVLGYYSSFAKDLGLIASLFLWVAAHAVLFLAYPRMRVWALAPAVIFYVYFAGWLSGSIHAALFWGAAVWVDRERPEPFDLERRQSLKAAALGGLTLLLGVVAAAILRWIAPGGGIVGGSDPRAPAAPTLWSRIADGGRILWDRIRGLSPEVTPQSRLYYVSKNLRMLDPGIEAAEYRLEVGGMVAVPYTLTLDELMALPAVEFTYTLSCISNPIGGDLIGNCVWTGVRLSDLLARADPLPGADWLVSRAADDYVESSPLAALPAETMVAFAINGEPLFKRHGYPNRLLIPGLYGMKMPKWLTGLAVGPEQVLGFWAQRGWSETAEIRTLSRIDTPREGDVVSAGREYAVAGIAYAGGRGIRAVEVSTNGGEGWARARLKPPLGDYTWHLWTYRWQPETAGERILVVRAVETGGRVQPAERTRPLPAGATGYHRVPVVVQG